MANARMRHEWNQTADTLALLANINRKRELRPLTRADFHPMIHTQIQSRRPGIELTPEVLRSRRKMFS